MGNKHSKPPASSSDKSKNLDTASVLEKFREAYSNGSGNLNQSATSFRPPPPYPMDDANNSPNQDSNNEQVVQPASAPEPKHECPQHMVVPVTDIKLYTSDGKYVVIDGLALFFTSDDFFDKLNYIAGQTPTRSLRFHDERYETYDVLSRYKTLVEGKELTPPDKSENPKRECELIGDLIYKLNLWKGTNILNILKFQLINWIYQGQVSPKHAITLAGKLNDPKLVGTVMKCEAQREYERNNPLISLDKHMTTSTVVAVENWKEYIPTRWQEAFGRAIEETSSMGDTDERWKACADAFEKALA
ncbi:uncharacterized protein L199_001490 [Kwoniella botswanensis]|uniref:uncharacterized protein n=1 Tax=Kwoniella botswanensis TaxID=1268659 RepID=UPI00315D1611